MESIQVQARRPVRLDVFLTRRLSHVSRTRIQRHIAAGDVLVGGQRVRPNHLLSGGEVITVPELEEPGAMAVTPIDVCVAYEDRDLLVVEKPAGLVVHPVSGELRNTLLTGLRARQALRGEDPGELGLVHRLDRSTSGLVLVAKNLVVKRALARDLEARRIRRVYRAVVLGVPAAPNGIIDLHVRRDPSRTTRMQALDQEALASALREGWKPHVSPSGYSDSHRDIRPRRARTYYRVIRPLRGAALVELELDTGRTHQIRVHLQGIGSPILGDPIYGPVPETTARPEAVNAVATGRLLGRPALHAAVLCFRHPSSGRSLEFHMPVPEDLRLLIDRLEVPSAFLDPTRP